VGSCQSVTADRHGRLSSSSSHSTTLVPYPIRLNRPKCPWTALVRRTPGPRLLMGPRHFRRRDHDWTSNTDGWRAYFKNIRTSFRVRQSSQPQSIIRRIAKHLAPALRERRSRFPGVNKAGVTAASRSNKVLDGTEPATITVWGCTVARRGCRDTAKYLSGADRIIILRQKVLCEREDGHRKRDHIAGSAIRDLSTSPRQPRDLGKSGKRR